MFIVQQCDTTGLTKKHQEGQGRGGGGGLKREKGRRRRISLAERKKSNAEDGIFFTSCSLRIKFDP